MEVFEMRYEKLKNTRKEVGYLAEDVAYHLPNHGIPLVAGAALFMGMMMTVGYVGSKKNVTKHCEGVIERKVQTGEIKTLDGCVQNTLRKNLDRNLKGE
jgi:hypothetical protein